MIRFKCKHCKKALGVKDQLAGRKAVCPACHKPFVIPKPKPSAAELEDLAASLLSDEPAAKKAEPEPAVKAIKFHCEFCDEAVEVPLTEAGTKMPCPECKRIIRVPVPEENKPKDWRDLMKKGPSAALQNQPEQLDNAWGTEQKSRVSSAALVEAEAVPQKAVPFNPGLWVKRGFWCVLALGIAYAAIAGMNRSRQNIREKMALEDALKMLDDKGKKLPGEWMAEVHRAAGEVYCCKRKPAQAQQHFRTALATMRQRSEKCKAVDLDFFLIELALTQTELGGTEDEILSKERIAWSQVERDVKQTLNEVSPDRRGLAIRLVGARLTDKKQIHIAIGVAGMAPVQQTGLKIMYKAELERALREPDKQDKNVRPAPAGLTDNLPPAPKADGPIELSVRVAHVEALARQGKEKYKEALELAAARREKTPEEALHCLEACVSGAELALCDANLKNPASEAAPFVQKGLEAVKELDESKTPVPPWLMFELVRAGIEAKVDVQELAKSLDKEYQPHLQLAIFRRKLAEAGAAFTEVSEIGMYDQQRESLAWVLAWEALARQNARHGRGREAILSLANSIGDDSLRPFLLIGMALGENDHGK